MTVSLGRGIYSTECLHITQCWEFNISQSLPTTTECQQTLFKAQWPQQYNSAVVFHVPLNALYVILGTTFAANHLNDAKMGFTPNQTATQKTKQQLYKKS